MMASGAFPDVAIKMVEVGESTGALQEMLNSLSEFYDEEIETSLTRFITIVEPALLVIMGIIIAALLLSLYMPLFNLSSMISLRNSCHFHSPVFSVRGNWPPLTGDWKLETGN